MTIYNLITHSSSRSPRSVDRSASRHSVRLSAFNPLRHPFHRIGTTHVKNNCDHGAAPFRGFRSSGFRVESIMNVLWLFIFYTLEIIYVQIFVRIYHYICAHIVFIYATGALPVFGRKKTTFCLVKHRRHKHIEMESLENYYWFNITYSIFGFGWVEWLGRVHADCCCCVTSFFL